jgi:hypothetical protein
MLLVVICSLSTADLKRIRQWISERLITLITSALAHARARALARMSGVREHDTHVAHVACGNL